MFCLLLIFEPPATLISLIFYCCCFFVSIFCSINFCILWISACVSSCLALYKCSSISLRNLKSYLRACHLYPYINPLLLRKQQFSYQKNWKQIEHDKCCHLSPFMSYQSISRIDWEISGWGRCISKSITSYHTCTVIETGVLTQCICRVTSIGNPIMEILESHDTLMWKTLYW